MSKLKIKKHRINLIEEDEENKTSYKRIIIIILFVFLALLLTFYTFFNILKLNSLKSKIKEQDNNLAILQKELMNSTDIENEYLKYGYSYQNENEKKTCNKSEVLRMLDNYFICEGDVSNFKIIENNSSITIENISIERVNSIIKKIKNELPELVSYISTKRAESDDGSIVDIMIAFN